MKLDELEVLLRAWGRAYGEKAPADEPEDVDDLSGQWVTPSHPLARGMESAPGETAVIIRQRTTMDRGGTARRRLMAEKAGTGMRILPAEYVDHIACTETRTGRAPWRGKPIPPQVQRVQQEVQTLERLDMTRGVCLRVHYCRRGSLDDRAYFAGEILEHEVKVRVYRTAVTEARFWMLGRLTQE